MLIKLPIVSFRLALRPMVGLVSRALVVRSIVVSVVCFTGFPKPNGRIRGGILYIVVVGVVSCEAYDTSATGERPRSVGFPLASLLVFSRPRRRNHASRFQEGA